ncbi:MAG: YqeG family HAD IIIA-type phosphatase [Ruminococcaceae bacterium]|nr:YqeG family HAD IIIA-type phosphatase [Oscillospiraceae bacterium]
MILRKKLTPDKMVKGFAEVTPELCREMGISGLICDIDNTLATYDDDDMPAAVEKWITVMKGSGIGVAFVSNNTAARVERFIGGRDIKGFPDAHKPGTKYFKAAAEAIGCKDGGAAVLGDQLLTDALAAHRAGLPAIIVPPIKDRTGAFFRFKRWLERPYIRRYLKNDPDTGIMGTVWQK